MAMKKQPTRSRSKRATPTKTPPATVRRVARGGGRRRQGEKRPVLIVGVGASAGGLEAVSELLQALPVDPDFALVFVQHLAPHHDSALPMLLAARTRLKVLQAAEGMPVEANHVYVVPPNVEMTLVDHTLHLAARPTDRRQYTPIDAFLQSLAESAHERAVAVILSGTASDGAAGVREVKAGGGITIAQEPETARYDGMPRAAIASGAVDLILPPRAIAQELVSIARHPLTQNDGAMAEARTGEPPPSTESLMDQVFGYLRAASGVDFRRYKRPTIDRRLQRRMVLHKLTRLEDYIRYLRDNPDEVQALYRDILIHVTRFFRDSDTFVALAAEVFGAIVREQLDEQPIRIWVAACATGEEAYSVAITALESLSEHHRATPVQVFATDISEPAIEFARAGIYPDSIAADVSPERLRRFFTKVEGGYRISKTVRDMCIFARQDLTRDPPFSKLDVVMCRNVLIYLGGDLQQQLIGVFHYALKPKGFLVLGTAETIGAHSDLFAPLDRKQRIYRKKTGVAADLHLHLEYGRPGTRARPQLPAERDAAHNAESEATRLIQERYAPPGVIIDDAFNVVQFRGQTGSFLEPAPGEPSMNLLKMLREGLLHGVREALQQARKAKGAVPKRDLRVRANGGWREVVLEVTPLRSGDRLYFLVLFDDAADGQKARRGAAPPRATDSGASAPRVARLQRELASNREYLQSIIQDLEASNEEMQSANEEVLSANEELQSTNEELDTAKEELQSTNEELNTVNEELQGRNEELSRLNSDLVNLLSSVQIAIVIVASDLRIRRFTPMAERVLNLIPSDVGRPISQIKPNIDCPDLEQLIATVIDRVTPCEREVRDAQGNIFALRIRPYKNSENRIDGAVLALFDREGTGLDKAASTEDVAVTLADFIRSPVVLLDVELRVRHLNQAFVDQFGADREASRQRLFFELDDGFWDVAELRLLLASPPGASPPPEVELVRDRHGAPPLHLLASARYLGKDASLIALILEQKDVQPVT